MLVIIQVLIRGNFIKKLTAFLIPIFIFGIFFIVLQSTTIMKKPFNQFQEIDQLIIEIGSDISSEKWSEAKSQTESLEVEWKRIVPKIQFSSERDNITSITRNIARLKGAIDAKDKSGALQEISEAKSNWQDIGK